MPISVPVSHSANIDSMVGSRLFIVPLQVESNVCHELHTMMVGTVVVATLLSVSNEGLQPLLSSRTRLLEDPSTVFPSRQHVSNRRTDTHDRQIAS